MKFCSAGRESMMMRTRRPRRCCTIAAVAAIMPYISRAVELLPSMSAGSSPAVYMSVFAMCAP